MLEGVFKRPGNPLKLTLTAIIVLFGVLLCSGALAVTVNLVDGNGAPVSGFRWTLQEDATFHVDPDVLDTNPLSLNFHKSYMPVVSVGSSPGSSANITLPNPSKYYFVSLLSTSGGYTMGGTQVKPGETSKTVTVHENPVPTAQISIFVFEDKNPINNAPDLPAEHGLPHHVRSGARDSVGFRRKRGTAIETSLPAGRGVAAAIRARNRFTLIRQECPFLSEIPR